jgi:hypothetical protein
MLDLDTIKARAEEFEKLKGETTAGEWEFEQAGEHGRTLEVWGTTIYAQPRDLELTEKIIHLLWIF